MYASCYLLTKVENLAQNTPEIPSRSLSAREGTVELEKLEI